MKRELMLHLLILLPYLLRTRVCPRVLSFVNRVTEAYCTVHASAAVATAAVAMAPALTPATALA